MQLADILTPDSVRVPLKAVDRKAAIEELIDLLAAAGRITKADELKKAVWDREQQRSTGIGDGLAIPHGKTPALNQLVMAIGKTAQPIDFQSLDRKPVRLVILLASPPDKTGEHIQALGRISRLMNNDTFRSFAFNAESADELYDLFKSAE